MGDVLLSSSLVMLLLMLVLDHRNYNKIKFVDLYFS